MNPKLTGDLIQLHESESPLLLVQGFQLKMFFQAFDTLVLFLFLPQILLRRIELGPKSSHF